MPWPFSDWRYGAFVLNKGDREHIQIEPSGTLETCPVHHTIRSDTLSTRTVKTLLLAGESFFCPIYDVETAEYHMKI
jgi:hypothetical protein